MSNEYPTSSLITDDALQSIQIYSAEGFDRAGTEWGGLLWGKVFRNPDGGLVPVIVAATNGVCRATRTSCEILPESWPAAHAELRRVGLGGLQNIGDYHSHPGFGIFLSQHADVPSFWSYGYISWWLSLVFDQQADDYGVFAKDSSTTLRRIRCNVIPSDSLPVIGVSRTAPFERFARKEMPH